MTSIHNSKFISRRTFLKLATIVGIATSGASVIYGNQIEPNDIDVTQHDIPFSKLSPEFDEYKIVQITDLHMGSWLNQERLATAVDIINSENPDLVAITGDFVTLGRIEPYADDLIEGLSRIQARDGVVAVLGNHDHWSNTDLIRDMLNKANIKELPNEHITIERDSAKLIIAGLDDVWEEKDDLDKLVANLPSDLPAVLLAHEPDIADKTSQTGLFGLQLSGHSHGGQIRFPIIDAPILPRLGQKYPMGRYQVGDMVQYTNRGIGMTDLPIRINCRPEISIFRLLAET